MILCFSGVGNSRYVADRIARSTRDKYVMISDLLKEEKFEIELDENEKLGIISPVYFLGLPSDVSEYLSKITIKSKNKPYVYTVCTYGMSTGNYSYIISDLLDKRNIDLNGRFSIKYPDTWTPIYSVKSKKKNRNIIKKADKKLLKVIDSIKKEVHGDYMNSKLPRSLGKRFVNSYSRARNTNHLHVDVNRCIGCGMCAKHCPSGAIKMRDGHPVWIKEKCNMCLGCLHRCPKFAIDYDKKTMKHGQYSNPKMLYNSVLIKRNNPGIDKQDNCTNCGICKDVCIEREAQPLPEDRLGCLYCGQCIIACPRKNLRPKNEIDKLLEAKKKGKVCIAYTAPGVRVSVGDQFGYKPGEFLEGKLVGLLKELGFEYVFDVCFGADLTIMEEASELIERKKNNDNLPMITSCCPSWVRFCETFYSDLIPHLSSCKSPIAMQGAMVENYFTKVSGIKKNDIYTVAITPCTAKKSEVIRDEINGTDSVITIAEVCNYIKEKGIKLDRIEEKEFDKLMGTGSGAGLIFGNSGGVMEAALRSANYFITGNDLEKVEFSKVHGYNGAREATVTFGDIKLKCLAVDEMSNAIPILNDIRDGKSDYDFIEIMNCRGGCIGGGGQPIYDRDEEDFVKSARMKSMYKRDKELKYRYSYKNPEIKKIYKEFLDKPLSPKAKKYLHTTYSKKEVDN